MLDCTVFGISDHLVIVGVLKIVGNAYTYQTRDDDCSVIVIDNCIVVLTDITHSLIVLMKTKNQG